MKRSGPLRDRLVLRAMRLSVGLWGQAERVGIDLIGASEGPPLPDPARRKELDAVVTPALSRSPGARRSTATEPWMRRPASTPRTNC